MTLEELVNLCRGYDQLGSAVQSQVDDVLDGRVEDCNPNALVTIRDWLAKVEAQSGNDEELADEVGGWLEDVRDALKRATDVDGAR